MLYNDDCLTVLKTLPNDTIDMIYLDPPFFTQKTQALQDATGNRYTFSDIWSSRTQYLDYMKTRLEEMKRVLKKTGSIFFHCDSTSSHYLRVLLDQVFGEKNFRSEIIWVYKRWSNSRNGLLPNHQTIFFYSKSNSYKFHKQYGDYSFTTNIDQLQQERIRDKAGKSVYKRTLEGTVAVSKEKKGVPLSDVWEIPFLNPRAKERTGYPTQKPIELLDRILTISTDEGDCVLDPFCGSGTTLVSARLLKREYIGIDINPDAIRLCYQRLAVPYKTSSALLKKGIAAYQTKSEEILSILKQFDCDVVQRNQGIDALTRKHYCGSPIAIKIQKSDESFGEAIKLLYRSVQRKKFTFALLLTHETNWQDSYIIPQNIIVLPRYEAQLQSILEKILGPQALSG